MALLRQIEGWLERAVEGGARALFRHRLQPIELAKAAARAMQSQRQVGPEGVEVPNSFTIALHPDDLAELSAYRAGLEGRLARYLSGFADERGLVPVGPVAVSIVGDPALRRRSLRVEAVMADLEAGPATRPAAPIGATEPLPRLRRAPSDAPAIAAGSLLLVLEDGRQVALANQTVKIGRALDNDLVIADGRVSRYHAQLERDADGVLIRDLGSTNGTAVAGRAIREERLADGARLALGGYTIDVYLGRPHRPTAPGRPA